MSILITGMEMPEGALGAVPVIIFADGVVRHYFSHLKLGDAIPVPPHGRLIDAAALWVEINKICDRRDAGIITDLTCLQQILSAVRHAPTIIPADHFRDDPKLQEEVNTDVK